MAKATAFAVDGSMVMTISRRLRPHHPAPGMSERDPEAMWGALLDALKELLTTPEASAERVIAIGLTAHGNGLYLVDSAGRPVRPAVMAADNRAAARVRRWMAEGLQEVLQARSWNGLWAGQPGPILSDLARKDTDALGAAAAALSCKDFLWARFTGVLETELTAASAGGLYDSSAWAMTGQRAKLEVNELALEAFGLQEWRHLLGDPIEPETVRPIDASLAEELGLRADTPVVAGVVDNSAVQHGSGIFDGSAIGIGAGTWSINQVLVPVAHAEKRSALIRPYAAAIALSGTALFCEASPTSGSNLDWAINHAVTAQQGIDRGNSLDGFGQRLKRERGRARRMDDPMFLPFVDGSRNEAGARGAWLGLSSANGEDELIGAVIEGICLEHRRHVDRLQSALPGLLPVRLSGGVAKSEVWCQIFADTLGVPVMVSPVAELGSVCAAALAGVSVGAFPSVPAGVAVLNPDWLRYEPDPGRRDFYETRYERYTALATYLDSFVW